MRGVTATISQLDVPALFQLTRLMRGVTRNLCICSVVLLEFQLTRLMRGVTASASGHYIFIRFQLTRLMRGVTERLTFESAPARISTHTPHARRDPRN